MTLLERTVSGIASRLVLLAPAGAPVPEHFVNVDFDFDRHQRVLRAVQRFRGSVYLADGAVSQEQLGPEGLHRTAEDDQSWHLVLLDGQGEIAASAWYRDYPSQVHLQRLRLRQCPLAMASEWRDRLWVAVEHELALARRQGLRYAELGGWAVSEACRRSGDTLGIALAAYALGRVFGDSLGITTATVKHGSSRILRGLGGQPLELDGEEIPPYFDPHYNSLMELVRFDSRHPARRYAPGIALVQRRLMDARVVARPYWPMTFRAPSPARVVEHHAMMPSFMSEGLAATA
ncbi:MAG: hypothetical protein JSU08_16195 [Acidobacteria bacterium]|nr:hypothetical protein [Acidobacteriota bacterium]